MLGTMLTLFSNLGILIGFLVGYYFEYAVVPKILLMFPVVFLVSFYCFPETPWFLVKQNKIQVGFQ